MIKLIKRKHLDNIKYDYCIENSHQSRIYAFSWYLDIVADNWDVLVLNDYDAVMPLPWKRKFGLKYITQPYFCQQIGVFSLHELSKKDENNFIKKIPFSFIKIALALNAENHHFLNDISVNYLLDLNFEYAILKKNFSKGRKHAIQKGIKKKLALKFIDLDEIVALQKNNYTYSFPEDKLQKLYYATNERKIAKLLGIYDGDTFLGGGLFLRHKNRIIYLFSAFNALGRKMQASSFLLSYMIQQESLNNIILDFEGGNMPNIGKFYRSFGAHPESYTTIQCYNIELFFKT